MAFTLCSFAGENVTPESLRPLDFPGAGLLESLGGTFFCFHFRHIDNSLKNNIDGRI